MPLRRRAQAAQELAAAMSVEKIARMLRRRPPQGKFREQLFWLVDLVYACKASGDRNVETSARLVEDALGCLGEFLETGSEQALGNASEHIEEFGRVIKAAVATLKPETE